MDHTTGTTYGKYIYLETSYPAIEGDIARIESPFFEESEQSYCMEFWYHMYGDSIGALNVYKKNDQEKEEQIWRLTGESVNAWLLARVPINFTEAGTIIIEGVKGDSNTR